MAPWLAPFSEGLALGLVVLTITYLSLVVGELVPKRMGLSNPEGSVDLGGRGFETVGGLIAAPLGRVPSEGDALHFHGFALTVEEVVGLRVGRVLVSGRSRDSEPD